jgi:two-component system, cell cycle sensor histidine kinase and response regulator CckA
VRTILVVEDYGPWRQLVAGWLREAGFVVIEAGDVETAVKRAERPGSIDAYVVDSLLPGAEPFDLGSQLRELQPAAAALRMSGHDPAELRRAGLLGERELMLRKPFSRDQLLEAVDAALGASSDRR